MLKLDSLHFKHNTERRKLIFFDKFPFDLFLFITFVHNILKRQANETSDILHKKDKQARLIRKEISKNPLSQMYVRSSVSEQKYVTSCN